MIWAPIASINPRQASRKSKCPDQLRRGALAEVIVTEARRLGVDMIVMGTLGRVGLNAFWSGSLAPRVTERTHLALLLVPVSV
jgi:nucleotide-binding universal stress UspA family protein